MRRGHRRTSMFVDPSRGARTHGSADRALAWSSAPSGARKELVPGRLAWRSLVHLPHGLVVLGQSGEVLDANCQAETIFGYPTGYLVGIPISRLVPQQSSSDPER